MLPTPGTRLRAQSRVPPFHATSNKPEDQSARLHRHHAIVVHAGLKTPRAMLSGAESMDAHRRADRQVEPYLVVLCVRIRSVSLF